MFQHQPDETPVNLFNPSEDFTFTLANDDNVPVGYVLKGNEITTLPKYIADHGANKLADKIVWQRGIRDNYELDKANVLKEIYIDERH